MIDSNDDAERHRQTQKTNEMAQRAIAESRELMVQLNASMDNLEYSVTLRKGARRAQR